MKDPFPFQPPLALTKAVKPVCDALGMTILPLHLHEVLFAIALYTTVQTIIGPALSKLIVPKRYAGFNRRTRINWNVHIVSFTQSVLISTLSLWLMANDPERRAWADDDNWERRLWAYDGASAMVASFGLGYFLWDFFMCARYLNIFGPGMLFHSIAAVTVYSFCFRPWVLFYAPVFLLYEFSSPFLNIHWFCDKLDLTGSVYQAVNGVFLVSSFFICRLMWGNWNSYLGAYDLYTAYNAGHSDWNNTGIIRGREWPDHLFKDGQYTDQLTGLRYTNMDVKTGDVTAMISSTRYMPVWLAIAYLSSNFGLNTLNVYWFSKMIETIRKRFPPPWGTKGVGEKEVHWQPRDEDKAKKLLGEGEVPVDGKSDGKNGDANWTGADGTDVDAARAVYADGHKGVEITGRNLRSRRKA